ncbi:unnamed protein product [Danaus chrysippus]|uniref:Mediator of RNA polymerase II transcription subunit 13 n=1 Tax=Danaus chrysippus TaxID=151541 RepID=A0A8J2R7U1_9NEOP|nr:unnamed protein product [Danaus chrysippus]
MTHQNHQTNGASLEDCHTNFFALTELYGIKWRKLVWGETSGACGEGEEGAAPLADPVISSYARCLAGDILCVWRRVPAPQPLDIDIGLAAPPPLSLRASKELWIFWYGEEPDLNGLVAPELITSQGDQGSWESGLSYECRSLLFKALHNLIERCLLSRDFVRLGKWFVQPYDGDEEDVGKSSPWHLSFSFAFFLHGESTVCASVDVRQHPPVRTLTAKRLARLHTPPADRRGDNKVILAPFGLEGRVTGREWGENDPATARLLDAWRQLYPLEQGCGAVEVECGGVRIPYPAPYALLTEMETCRDAAPPAAELAARAHWPRSPRRTRTRRRRCVTRSRRGDPNDDFLDPTRKTPCTCAKASGCGAGCAGGGGACSPGSCGASPAAATSPAALTHAAHGQLTALTTHQQVSVPTTLHTPAPTPDPLAPPTPRPALRAASQAVRAGRVSCRSGGGPCAGQAPPEALRRPSLPPPEKRLDPLEDEHSLHMLYDYTTVHAWLEHPCENASRAAASLPAKKQDQEDVKEYKNLFTSDGLCPTLKDLDQIFDNSDDAASGDETLQVQTPPDSNKSSEEARGLSGRCVRAEELSKMFPTPPQHGGARAALAGVSPRPTTTRISTRTRCDHTARRRPDPVIEDWSYVFQAAHDMQVRGLVQVRAAHCAAEPAAASRSAALHRRVPSAVAARRGSETTTRRQAHRSDSVSGTSGSSTNTTTTTTSGRQAVVVQHGAGDIQQQQRRGGVPAVPPAGRRARPPARRPRPPRAPAPACPLLLNVLLADTVLNVFRETTTSTAARSACVTLERGTVGRGCFYEDEMEITGIAEEPGGGSGGGLAGTWAGLVVAACAAPAGGAASALTRAARGAAAPPLADHLRLNLLEYSDGGAAAARALRAAAGSSGSSLPTPNIATGANSAVHRWPFIGARAPRSSRGRCQTDASPAAAAAGRHPEALLRRAHVGRRVGPADVAPVPPAGRGARERGPVRAAARAAAAGGPRPGLGLAVALRAAPLGALVAGALLVRPGRGLRGAGGGRRRAVRAAQDLLQGSVGVLRGLSARQTSTDHQDSQGRDRADRARRRRPRYEL